MPDLKLGDKAPDFTLPAGSGEKITLSEEVKKGPVVLAWYLFDFGRI
jgi:peroxiredoxin